MKTVIMSLTLIALLLLAVPSFAGNNGREYDADVQVLLGQPTIGVVKYTAAINADGSVANCFGCNRSVAETRRISAGTYEVDFTGDIRATLGWSRWVQVDTLSIGSIGGNVNCTTADRLGDVSSIWVFCTNSNGLAQDTSFFLFVAR